MRVGEHQFLKVTRETAHGLYLSDGKEEVLLPRGQVPADYKIGERIRVFVLTDSEDRPVATTKNPVAKVGEFAMLKVVSVTTAGAFLDWGLDKDLFCPIREQRVPLREGEEAIVRIYLDEVSQRVVCSTKLSRFLSPEGKHLRAGQPVQILVTGRGPDLVSVIVDEQFKGSIFPDEWTEPLRVGDRKDAYVKSVRPEDHKIAISLRPQGFRAVMATRNAVLEALEQNGGSLAVSDKSPPEEIQRLFGMSKGSFKKLIGSLYKEGLIEIADDEIRLAGG